MVATGQTDIGFADAPAAMQLRTKGAPVKIVAPVLQTNGFAIISLEESNIQSPKDLIGKKVAVQPGTAQTTLLDAILAANGIDKSFKPLLSKGQNAFRTISDWEKFSGGFINTLVCGLCRQHDCRLVAVARDQLDQLAARHAVLVADAVRARDPAPREFVDHAAEGIPAGEHGQCAGLRSEEHTSELQSH